MQLTIEVQTVICQLILVPIRKQQYRDLVTSSAFMAVGVWYSLPAFFYDRMADRLQQQRATWTWGLWASGQQNTPGPLGCCLQSRVCLFSFSSNAPTKQALWSEELCKCAAKRYLAKWNIDKPVTREPSSLIAEDGYITMSVFESLLLNKTHTIKEEEAGSSTGGMKNWTDLIAAVLESKTHWFSDPFRACLQLTIHWIHKSDSKWAKNQEILWAWVHVWLMVWKVSY